MGRARHNTVHVWYSKWGLIAPPRIVFRGVIRPSPSGSVITGTFVAPWGRQAAVVGLVAGWAFASLAILAGILQIQESGLLILLVGFGSWFAVSVAGTLLLRTAHRLLWAYSKSDRDAIEAFLRRALREAAA